MGVPLPVVNAGKIGRVGAILNTTIALFLQHPCVYI